MRPESRDTLQPHDPRTARLSRYSGHPAIADGTVICSTSKFKRPVGQLITICKVLDRCADRDCDKTCVYIPRMMFIITLLQERRESCIPSRAELFNREAHRVW